MSIVYKRTSKGEEEIQKRTYKLDHVKRFVLIMIDGKTDDESIISRSSIQWNPSQCLLELETMGFIENTDPLLEKNSGMGELKQNLILTIQEHLPNNHKKLVNKIINAEIAKPQILAAIDSGCMFVKLTVSEEISKTLKEELHKIVNNSQEI